MSGLAEFRLAVLGDCSTQHLVVALKGIAFTQGISLNVFDADYNQILPQVIDRNSELYKFQPDALLIYMCSEKLFETWCVTPCEERIRFADITYARIKEYWSLITSYGSASILQFTFVENEDSVSGNYACKRPDSFIYQLRKLNMLLMDGSSQNSSVYLIDLCGIQSRVGRENMFDAKLYYSAKIPISLSVLPLVAANVIDVIRAFRGKTTKCVILDLDDTLWGGTIGDDGLSGIQIGELGLGHAFSEFQMWLKELKKRGILLAVCSKNEDSVAKTPFIKLDDMVLRLEDFTVFIANWEDKASNIQCIQKMLNIGMDSIVFIDDNPFERELVRSLIPQIIVPDLPEDPADFLPYLKRLNLFETASFSEEDTKRTDLYRTEAIREALRSQYTSFDEYLQSLEMIALAAPFDDLHIPRIAQLTQRSNQFNLRTVRYTEREIFTIANDPNRITLYFTLKDKLADHGLISVVIMDKREDNSLFLDTWLMSCRVLKRGMEEFIVNKIIETGRGLGFNSIIGEYIQTSKNAMVSGVYEKLGFIRVGESTFVADVLSFANNKTYIKEHGHEPR